MFPRVQAKVTMVRLMAHCEGPATLDGTFYILLIAPVSAISHLVIIAAFKNVSSVEVFPKSHAAVLGCCTVPEQ